MELSLYLNLENWSWQLTISLVQNVLRKHIGKDMPHVYDISKNVSFMWVLILIIFI